MSQKTRPATLLKKRLWHMCFPVNLAKFLITAFFIEHLRWLLLLLDEIQNTKKMKTRESKERKFEKKVREIGLVVLIFNEILNEMFVFGIPFIYYV